MSKGRNTTRISIRLPDEVLEDLKGRAKKKGIGYTALARQFIQSKCGFQPK